MTLDMMEVMGYIQRVPDTPYTAGTPSWPMANTLSPISSLNGFPMGASMMAMQNPLQGMSSWPGMATGNGMSSVPGVSPDDSVRLSPAPANALQPGNGSIQLKPSDLAALLGAIQRPNDSIAPPLADNQAPVTTAPAMEAPSSSPATTSPGSSSFTGEGNTTVEDLSGVWRGKNQDVLVVTGRRFIWTDKDAKTIEGEIAVQGDKLLTRLNSNGSVMAYHFKSEGDRFVAVTDTGYQYIFQRSK